MRGSGAPFDQKGVLSGGGGYEFPECRTRCVSFDVFDRKIYVASSQNLKRSSAMVPKHNQDIQRTMFAYPGLRQSQPSDGFLGPKRL